MVSVVPLFHIRELLAGNAILHMSKLGANHLDLLHGGC